MPFVYDPKTKSNIELSAAEAEKEILSGQKAALKGDIGVADKSGAFAGTVPSDKVGDYLASGQYHLATDQQVDFHNKELEHPIVMGAVGTAADRFANQALLGVPDAVTANTSASSPEVEAELARLNAQHGTAAAIGNVGGFAASLYNPMMAGAQGLGHLAEGAATNLLGDSAASLAGRSLIGATKLGTEAATLAAPQALLESDLGNPADIAEHLGYGLLGGAVVGGALGATSPLLKAAGKTLLGAIGKPIGLDLESSDPLKSITDNQAIRAMFYGTDKSGIKEIDNVGRDQVASFLKDNDLVKRPGENFENYEARFNQYKEGIGKQIGDLYSQVGNVEATPVDDIINRIKKEVVNPLNKVATKRAEKAAVEKYLADFKDAASYIHGDRITSEARQAAEEGQGLGDTAPVSTQPTMDLNTADLMPDEQPSGDLSNSLKNTAPLKMDTIARGIDEREAIAEHNEKFRIQEENKAKAAAGRVENANAATNKGGMPRGPIAEAAAAAENPTMNVSGRDLLPEDTINVSSRDLIPEEPKYPDTLNENFKGGRTGRDLIPEEPKYPDTLNENFKGGRTGGKFANTGTGTLVDEGEKFPEEAVSTPKRRGKFANTGTGTLVDEGEKFPEEAAQKVPDTAPDVKTPETTLPEEPVKLTLGELWDQRRALDDKIYAEKRAQLGNPSPLHQEFINIRNILDQEIKEKGEEAMAKMGKQFKNPLNELNKQYHMASVASNVIENSKFSELSRRNFSLSDHLAGMGAMGGAAMRGNLGGIAAAGMGLAGGIANKYMRENGNALVAKYGNKLSLWLADAANAEGESRLAKIPKILRGLNDIKDKAVPAGIGRASNAFDLYTGQKSKNQEQGFDNMKNHLMAAIQDPDQNSEIIKVLNDGAPNVGAAYQAQNRKVLSYLYNAMPKNPNVDQPFQTPWKPLPSQLKKFNDQTLIVADPYNIFHEIQKGTVNKNHVEALKSVYPGRYDAFKNEIMSYGMTPNHNISYKHKLLLSLVVGQPLDQSLKNINLSQASYAPAANEGKPLAKGKLSKLPQSDYTEIQQTRMD